MHWPVALVPERSTQPEGRPPQEAKLDKDGRKIVNRELSDNVLPTWREMEKVSHCDPNHHMLTSLSSLSSKASS